MLWDWAVRALSHSWKKETEGQNMMQSKRSVVGTGAGAGIRKGVCQGVCAPREGPKFLVVNDISPDARKRMKYRADFAEGDQNDAGGAKAVSAVGKKGAGRSGRGR